MSTSSAGTLITAAEVSLACKIIGFFNDWALRLATLASLACTLVLMLLADTRRHNKYPLLVLLVWAAYQVQPQVGGYALTHLTISSATTTTTTTTSSAREQQLVAFWAPLLLLHLAGPDNIVAFTLEDGKLSWRKLLDAIWKIIQALYVMLKYIYLCDSGVLRSASSIMVTLGVARYSESVVALLRGNMDNLWGSASAGDDERKPPQSTGEYGAAAAADKNEKELTTLLYSHTQFLACGRRAMADSSVDTDSPNYAIARNIFSQQDPDGVRKVAGMESSLMYDVLYTKVTVVHTWGGYLLRLVSPVGTATASSLFWLYPKDSEETPDVVITYILLAAAFFLDVVWLVRALGSTWAYSFLNARANMWLHHKLLCSGCWLRLRRILVGLDLLWLLGIRKDPSSRRMWSGRVGRYDLLAECTRRPSMVERLCTWLASNLRLEDIWKEYQHSRCISEALSSSEEPRRCCSSGFSRDCPAVLTAATPWRTSPHSGARRRSREEESGTSSKASSWVFSAVSSKRTSSCGTSAPPSSSPAAIDSCSRTRPTSISEQSRRCRTT